MKRTPFGMWIAVGHLCLLTSCTDYPTQQDIENDLEAQLSSVIGPWQGSAQGENPLILRFELAAQGDSLAGSGWQWLGDSADSTAVTVHGRFQRPDLDLTFVGVKWEGETGTARFRGNYTTVGGILSNLQVSTPGHSASVPVLLHER